MADFETILYDKGGAVLTITLNRPDRYNALTEQMHKELSAALKEAAADQGVRAVILTGAGKAFCSGQDLKEIKDQPGRNLGDSLRKNYNPNILRIRQLEKPVICALNGVAAGAGMSVALACDVIIAAESASMIQSFVNIGLVPDSGSTWFLAQQVGYYRAFEITSSGRKLNAAELKELGLVHEVVSETNLLPRARELAAHYAAAPTKAIGLIKRGLHRMFTSDLPAALEYEAYLQEIASQSEDYREGVVAFNEKRKAVFKGA
ncbi:MAG TPA: enoyl-CoA hydratase-related protein [bacterium]